MNLLKTVARLGAFTAGVTLAAVSLAGPAQAAGGTIQQAGGATAVSGSYIVVLKDGVSTSATGLAARYGAAVGHTPSPSALGEGVC